MLAYRDDKGRITVANVTLMLQGSLEAKNAECKIFSRRTAGCSYITLVSDKTRQIHKTHKHR
jgi:hypothetical protein